MKPQPELLSFPEAVEFFRTKNLAVSPNSWRDVWAAENVHAFTVARVTATDVLEDIRNSVEKALREGIPLEQFKSEISRTLAAKGWPVGAGAKGGSILTPWRLETIYRTNIQSAYQAGRFSQMLETANLRPYWMYDAVSDRRTRPFHASLNGKVYRFDHPFWKTWYPPNGFNCRCTVRALSERRMRKMRLEPETVEPAFKPDEGFGYNPGMVRWQPDLGKYGPEARGRLTREMVGRPWDMPSLSKELTCLRDGYGGTGVLTTGPELHIAEVSSDRHIGWTNVKTGEIALNGSAYREVVRALKAGTVDTQSRFEAMKSVVHEFGHHLGYPVDFARYGTDQGYGALKETVNDLWAWQQLPGFLTTLGLKSDFDAMDVLARSRKGMYTRWAANLRDLFRKLGFDAAGEKAVITELNLMTKPEDLSGRLEKIIAERKPGFALKKPLGDMLLHFWDWEAFMLDLFG